MAAPVIVNSKVIPWSAAYPLNASGSFDATGADLLVVFFYTATGNITWDPSCTFAGTPGVLADRSSAGDINGGSLWIFTVKGFTPGTGTVAIQRSEYINDGAIYVVGFSGSQAVAVGGHDALATMALSASATDVAAGSNSVLLGLSGAISVNTAYTSTMTPAGSVLLSHTSSTLIRSFLYQGAGPAVGQPIGMATTVPFNHSAAGIIEILGSGGGGPVEPEEPVEFTVATPLAIHITTDTLPAVAIATGPVVVGALSVTPALGSVFMSPPQIDLSSSLGITISMPTVELAAPRIDLLGSLGLTVGLGAVEMGAPEMQASPLAISLALHPEGIVFPGLVYAAPLKVTLGLGSGNVTIRPVINADPLGVSLALGTGSIETLTIISPEPLSISLVPGEVEVLTYAPPIEAGPLPIDLDVGTGSVLVTPVFTAEPLAIDVGLGTAALNAPLGVVADALSLAIDLGEASFAIIAPPIQSDPLTLDLGIGTGSMHTLIVLGVLPLPINVRIPAVAMGEAATITAPSMPIWPDRRPKPYAGTRPLKLRIRIGRQFAGHHQITVG